MTFISVQSVQAEISANNVRKDTTISTIILCAQLALQFQAVKNVSGHLQEMFVMNPESIIVWNAPKIPLNPFCVPKTANIVMKAECAVESAENVKTDIMLIRMGAVQSVFTETVCSAKHLEDV